MGWVLPQVGPGMLATCSASQGYESAPGFVCESVCVCARTIYNAVGPWSVSGDDDVDINEVLFVSAKVGCTSLGSPQVTLSP